MSSTAQGLEDKPVALRYRSCQRGSMSEDDLSAHYAPGTEGSRLTRSAHGRLEYLRTQELVRRFLPSPPARVLDVGGGTGVHARWLVEDGYHVHLVDPVVHHVQAASELDGVSAERGDARDLSAPAGTIDAVLLLGPLYHLAEEHDRQLALRECGRVLRPGGVLFAGAISRYLSLMETGTSGRLSEDLLPVVHRVISTGGYDGHIGFVAGHWHTAPELEAEVRSCGFRDVAVYGIEGPAWATLDALELGLFEARQDSALRCARLVEQDPLFLHTSAHLLAIAHT